MASIWDLFVKLGIDTGEFTKGIGAAEGKAQSSSSAISSSFKSIATAVAASFSVAAIVDFAKSAVSAASDMNETLSKSQVVFGGLSVDIEKMGNTSAKSMGLSKQEAVAAAASYGNLFTAMGMGSKASADMSMSLVQLASDLASFNNIPVAEALEKIRAGLVGESEPLKSLGININEATLKQKAMTLGLSDGKEALSASAKAQAAYAIMLEQSTKAQGDFARTSDGAANQQRILEANVKDMTASLGKGLLPAWVAVLKTLNGVIDTMSQLAQIESGYTDILNMHNREMQSTAKTYAEYRTEMERAIQVAGWQIDAEGKVYRMRQQGSIWVKEYTEAIKLDTQATFESNLAIAENARQLAVYSSASQGAAEDTRDWVLEQDKATAALKIADGAMKTTVNEALRPLTTAMLEQKIMASLSGEALLQYALQTGKLNQEAYNAITSLQQLTTQFDTNKNGVIDATEMTSEYWNELMKLQGLVVTTTLKADFSDWENTLKVIDEVLRKAREGGNWTPGTPFTNPTPTPTIPTTPTPGPVGGVPGWGSGTGGPANITNITVNPHYYRGDEPSLLQELSMIGAFAKAQ
jgi:hypothetical protein